MTGQARIVDLADLWMLFEIRGDRHGGCLMSVQADIECAHAADDQPGFHGSDDTAMPLTDRLADGVDFSCVFANQHAANQVAVAAQVFRGGMHDKIDAQLDRLLKERRTKGIVNISLDAMLLRQTGNRSQVCD